MRTCIKKSKLCIVLYSLLIGKNQNDKLQFERPFPTLDRAIHFSLKALNHNFFPRTQNIRHTADLLITCLFAYSSLT